MRTYRFKNTTQEFFCALCSSPRSLRYHRKLHTKHYLQILVLSTVFIYLLFPIMNFKGLIVIPIIWLTFESIYKLLYRKELACPFCGFDPTWYRRDVRLARLKVEQFLKDHPESQIFSPKYKQNKSSPSTIKDVSSLT